MTKINKKIKHNRNGVESVEENKYLVDKLGLRKDKIMKIEQERSIKEVL